MVPTGAVSGGGSLPVSPAGSPVEGSESTFLVMLTYDTLWSVALVESKVLQDSS